MGRWTTNDEEQAHLAQIVKERTDLNGIDGIVALKDGRKLSGVILLEGIANNQSGQSQADIIVRAEDESGRLVEHKIDVLDVAEIIPVSLN